MLALYSAFSVAGWSRMLTPDEIRPLLMTERSLGELLSFARADLVQTPLSFLLARGWLDLFGHTDAAVKAMVFVINAAALVLFAFFATRAIAGWHVAVLLCALTYARVGSALNLARMYGLLVLFVIVALIAWDRWRTHGDGRSLSIWVVAMTLAAYTHLSALLLLAALVAANFFVGRRPWAFAAAAVLPVLALLPWVAYVSTVFAERGIDENVRALREEPVRALAHLPFYLLSGENPGGGSELDRLYRQGISPSLKWIAVAVFVALAIVMVKRARSFWPPWRAPGTEAAWFWTASVIVAVPATVLFLFSVAVVPVINARYLLATLPAFCILLSILARQRDMATRVVVSVLLSWVGVSTIVALRAQSGPLAMQHAATAVADGMTKGDLVLCETHMPVGWQIYWEWTRRLGRPADEVVVLKSRVPAHLASIVPGQDLEDLNFDKYSRIWVVRDGYAVRHQIVSDKLAEAGFVKDSSRDGSDPHLTVFIRRSDGIRGF